MVESPRHFPVIARTSDGLDSGECALRDGPVYRVRDRLYRQAVHKNRLLPRNREMALPHIGFGIALSTLAATLPPRRKRERIMSEVKLEPCPLPWCASTDVEIEDHLFGQGLRWRAFAENAAPRHRGKLTNTQLNKNGAAPPTPNLPGCGLRSSGTKR